MYDVVVLGTREKLDLGELDVRTVHSADEVREVFSEPAPKLWLAPRASEIHLLADATSYPRKQAGLLVFEPIEADRVQCLMGLFKSVIAGATVLEGAELGEVLASPNRRDLFVAGIVDIKDRVLSLYRGDFAQLLVPFSWFEERPDGRKPDWTDFSVIDFGQTVRLGEYEVATDAVLYEFDADFRRRAKKRALQEDASFGAALRRLRLQRRLGRHDFPPISAKELARIERGEIDKPHEKTLRTVAERLGVRPEEIASY